MATLELPFSQARRHLSLLLRPTPPSPLPQYPRSLSSSSSSSCHDPTTQSDFTPLKRRKFQPPSMQPVSFAIKPKDPSPSPPHQNPTHSTPPPLPPRPDNWVIFDKRTWTREDLRYIKDMLYVSPVLYPSRVAPLPEDRVVVVVEEGGEGKEEEEEKELVKDERRIRKNKRRISRWGGGLRGVEMERVAFPRLIKQEQKNKKEGDEDLASRKIIRRGVLRRVEESMLIKQIYDLQEAILLVKAHAKAKFDETVEIHVNLAAELRRTDLKLDGVATLPHGTGKVVKIAVFAEGYAAAEARAAGAAIVGGVELVEEINSGNVKADFDICITTHKFVQQLDKAGTVTDDVAKAVRKAKQIVSFSEEALSENIGAFVNALLLAKPRGLKKSK
ncbi:hypothetical protein Vadar_020725 [Vaccinium darrowii]|uniref:Uncharacterized protein n=1 Tax=Vaccinium darrowii TaxID=229202 RepID=A0ACB7XT53_9ERIC|nr:hypothetical protein Vadar_020725 [Vaccinium darrowii]